MKSPAKHRSNAPRAAKCLSLFSGGLDSMLSARVLLQQGVEVHAIVFKSIFFGSERAERSAAILEIPIRVEDFTTNMLMILEEPAHGFGSGMNPCIDCRAAMLRRAVRIMEDDGFDFIITGEVLDQRPMTQNRRALDIVDSESGCGDRVLRPLSATLLAPSLPERLGLVDRSKLLDFQGRGRRRQIALAAQLGISDYPQPAGGCILTDPSYSARLKDLRNHEGFDDIRRLELLRVGRHFRIGGLKLIVGRNKPDNDILERSRGEDKILLKCGRFPGPSAVVEGRASLADIRMAAAICAMYADCPRNALAEITVISHGMTTAIRVAPANKADVESSRIQPARPPMPRRGEKRART